MLYEMLTGKKPFAADNLTAVTHRIVYEDPQPADEIVPEIKPALLEVIARALHKKPEDRYQSGDDLAADLRSSLAEPEPGARKTSGSFLAAPSAPTTTGSLDDVFGDPVAEAAEAGDGTVFAPIAPPVSEAPPGPSQPDCCT